MRDVRTSSQPEAPTSVLRAFLETESTLKRFLGRYAASRDDVEDIAQETIVRALLAEKDRSIEDPRAFLFGVAKNIVRKDMQKRSRYLTGLIEDLAVDAYAADDCAIDDRLDAHQQLAHFQEAMVALPARCRRVFMLKNLYDLSHKEIAQSLGISVSTVEKHAAAGLKRCSDYLQRATEAPASARREERSSRVVKPALSKKTHWGVSYVD